jgi:ubiquinone/menaquinone biosynthesis C-methylase UbiE
MVERSGFPLPKDVEEWFNGLGEEFLRSINVEAGHSVLDFGCRTGNYSVPAARVVGSTGKVYALDMNHEAVNELVARANALGLGNIIVPIKTRGELTIDLPDKSVDIALLYDVIHGILRSAGTLDPFRQLLEEVHRVIRNGGIFSLFVKHIEEIGFNLGDIVRETEKLFSYCGQSTTRLMHWDRLEEGTTRAFQKLE